MAALLSTASVVGERVLATLPCVVRERRRKQSRSSRSLSALTKMANKRRALREEAFTRAGVQSSVLEQSRASKAKQRESTQQPRPMYAGNSHPGTRKTKLTPGQHRRPQKEMPTQMHILAAELENRTRFSHCAYTSTERHVGEQLPAQAEHARRRQRVGYRFLRDSQWGWRCCCRWQRCFC